jgi:aerobic-type carbon monoxide dehydrogenase small subunit (CoxS/CutS family)
VLLDGLPVSSCTTLAVELDGAEAETVEGMRAGAALSAVQQAFVDEGAIQCGFCTPGFVVTAHALLREQAQPSKDTIIDYLDGNICRCSGYASIVRAVECARDTVSADRAQGVTHA